MILTFHTFWCNKKPSASPRAFYCTKMCEKAKSTTFSYYKSTQSLWCFFYLFFAPYQIVSVTRYYQTETVHARCDGSSVVQVASCSTHTAAEGNDCSLKMFRVDTCAHSVYRQQLSWYEGRDLPSSRRLWCNGRQTSQYRRSGNVEEGREGTRQTLDLVTPIAFFASTCRVATSFTTTSAIKSLEPLTIDCMFAKAFIHLQRASLAFVIHCHFSSNFNYTLFVEL